LDIAREKDNKLDIELATKVLNIAVLSIIITALFGTLIIYIAAPRLLKRDDNETLN
jgi:hypothetical protein